MGSWAVVVILYLLALLPLLNGKDSGIEGVDTHGKIPPGTSSLLVVHIGADTKPLIWPTWVRRDLRICVDVGDADDDKLMHQPIVGSLQPDGQPLKDYTNDNDYTRDKGNHSLTGSFVSCLNAPSSELCALETATVMAALAWSQSCGVNFRVVDSTKCVRPSDTFTPEHATEGKEQVWFTVSPIPKPVMFVDDEGDGPMNMQQPVAHIPDSAPRKLGEAKVQTVLHEWVSGEHGQVVEVGGDVKRRPDGSIRNQHHSNRTQSEDRLISSTKKIVLSSSSSAPERLQQHQVGVADTASDDVGGVWMVQDSNGNTAKLERLEDAVVKIDSTLAFPMLVDVLIHELGHALGFGHEFLSPLRAQDHNGNFDDKLCSQVGGRPSIAVQPFPDVSNTEKEITNQQQRQQLDESERGVRMASMDELSVMGYVACGGKLRHTFSLSAVDKSSAAVVYGKPIPPSRLHGQWAVQLSRIPFETKSWTARPKSGGGGDEAKADGQVVGGDDGELTSDVKFVLDVTDGVATTAHALLRLEPGFLIFDDLPSKKENEGKLDLEAELSSAPKTSTDAVRHMVQDLSLEARSRLCKFFWEQPRHRGPSWMVDFFIRLKELERAQGWSGWLSVVMKKCLLPRETYESCGFVDVNVSLDLTSTDPSLKRSNTTHVNDASVMLLMCAPANSPTHVRAAIDLGNMRMLEVTDGGSAVALPIVFSPSPPIMPRARGDSQVGAVNVSADGAKAPSSPGKVAPGRGAQQPGDKTKRKLSIRVHFHNIVEEMFLVGRPRLRASKPFSSVTVEGGFVVVWSATLVKETQDTSVTSFPASWWVEKLLNLGKETQIRPAMGPAFPTESASYVPLTGAAHIPLAGDGDNDVADDDRIVDLWGSNGLLDLSHRSLTDALLLSILNRIDDSLVQIQNISSGVSSGHLNLESVHTVDVSGNKVSAIPRKLWTLFPHLKRLRASQNLLKSLYLPHSHPHLVELTVSDNSITNVHIDPTPFHNGEDRIDGTIDTPHGAVDTPYRRAHNWSSLRIFNCDHNQLRSFTFLKEIVFESLRDLSISSNKLTEPPYITAPALTKLDVSSNAITRLSLNLFPSVKELNIAFNDMYVVEFTESSHLQPPTCDLINLYAAGNLMTAIPKWIARCSRLRYLDVSYNVLSSATLNWSNLSRLALINMDNNQISEIVDEEECPSTDGGEGGTRQQCFASLDGLRVLTLRSNRLTLLPDVFHRSRELRRLDLSDNNIISLPDGIASLFPDIVYLSADKNSLQSVPPTLPTLQHLRTLSLEGNQLSQLPDVQPSPTVLPSLMRLNLARNRLQSLSPGLVYLKELRSLQVQHNEITNLHRFHSAIRDLDASYNKIDVFPQFDGCPPSRRLDLRHNRLRSVSLRGCGREIFLSDNAIEVCESFNSINYLDLSRNNLTEVPSCAQSSLTAILKENNIQILQARHLRSLRSDRGYIRHVDLSQNGMTGIVFSRSDVMLQSVHSRSDSLLTVDLRHNDFNFHNDYVTMTYREGFASAAFAWLETILLEHSGWPHPFNYTQPGAEFHSKLRMHSYDDGGLEWIQYEASNVDMMPTSLMLAPFVERLCLIGKGWRAFTLPDEPPAWDEMVTLKLINMGMLSVPEWIFTGLPNLQVLVLSQNPLRQLPSTLSHWDYALQLDVQSCHLTSLPPLPRSLQHLNVDYNSLSQLPDVPSASELIQLSARQNPLRNIDPLAKSPHLSTLELQRPLLKRLPDFLCDLPLKVLSLFVGPELESLPNCSMSDHLEKLQITDSPLSTLPPNLLDRSIRLMNLHLHGNNVKVVPHYPWHNMSKLSEVDLHSNHIEAIDSEILNHPNNVHLRVDGNNFKHLSNSSIVITGDNNKLESVGSMNLSLSQDQVIRLNNNILSRAPFLEGCSEYVHSLYMGNNRIDTFPTQALEACKKTKTVYLQRNRIPDLGSGADLPEDYKFATATIDISENALSSLNGIQRFPELTSLDASFNLLQDLEPLTVADVSKLRYLNLSHNALENLPSKWRCKTLRVLDLSHNNLTKIPSWGFFHSLRQLYLRHNSIKQLPQTLSRHRRFRKLRLKTLDISHNLIAQVPLGPIASYFNSKLRVFDASHNLITDACRLLYYGSRAQLFLSSNPLGRCNSSSYDKSDPDGSALRYILCHSYCSYTKDSQFKSQNLFKKCAHDRAMVVPLVLSSIEVAQELLKTVWIARLELYSLHSSAATDTGPLAEHTNVSLHDQLVQLVRNSVEGTVSINGNRNVTHFPLWHFLEQPSAFGLRKVSQFELHHRSDIGAIIFDKKTSPSPDSATATTFRTQHYHGFATTSKAFSFTSTESRLSPVLGVFSSSIAEQAPVRQAPVGAGDGGLFLASQNSNRLWTAQAALNFTNELPRVPGSSDSRRVVHPVQLFSGVDDLHAIFPHLKFLHTEVWQDSNEDGVKGVDRQDTTVQVFYAPTPCKSKSGNADFDANLSDTGASESSEDYQCFIALWTRHDAMLLNVPVAIYHSGTKTLRYIAKFTNEAATQLAVGRMCNVRGVHLVVPLSSACYDVERKCAVITYASREYCIPWFY